MRLPPGKAGAANQRSLPVTNAVLTAPAAPAIHPLAHLVPSASYRAKYIPRVYDGTRDLDILSNARALGKNVLISGPTGPGKTMLVYAAAAEANLPLVNISCNAGATVRSVIGGWTPLPNGGFDFVPGDFLLAVMYGGVGMFDEFNYLDPKIAVYLHAILDGRRAISIPEAVGSSFPTYIEAHPDFIVACTMNPPGAGYRGARDLSVAMADRFTFTIDVDYEPEIEKKFIPSPSLVDLATKIRDRVKVGDLVTPLSTRALDDFCAIAVNPAFTWEFAVANLVRKFKGEERTVVAKLIELSAAEIKVDLGLIDAPSTNPIRKEEF